jgi:hypothetical protein
MMIHWTSYLYIYPSWTDILAYYTDRTTDVTAVPSHPVATLAASDDAAAPGAPSLPDSLHWLPGPVPCDATSAALLNDWPGDAEHKTYALYSVLQGL